MRVAWTLPSLFYPASYIAPLSVRILSLQYQAVAVVLPYDVIQLRDRLTRLEKQLTAEHGGRKPHLSELAAAGGVSVTKAQKALQAGCMQVGWFVRDASC